MGPKTSTWFSVTIVVACFALPGGRRRADDDLAGPDAGLLAAWHEVATMVDTNQPWAACRERLAEGIARHGDSEFVPVCKQLIESIELAEARQSGLAEVNEHSSIAQLVAALPTARVDFRAVLAPHAYYEAMNQFVWDYYAQHSASAAADPAYCLYRRGRSVIGPLIESLSDMTATRSTAVEAENLQQPIVMRVCDISLALIEGVSLCRFDSRSGTRSLLSEWPARDREQLIDAVGAWWQATAALPPGEAVLWQIERTHHQLQLQMVDSLTAAGLQDDALKFLRAHYRKGDSIEGRLAQRMLRAGSRAPIEFIHEVVEGNRPLDRTMVELIGRNGEAGDFALLARWIEQACADGRRPMAGQLQMIAETLHPLGNTLCIPVYVAIIESYADEIEAEEVDDELELELSTFLGPAAERIQALSGVNFGFDPETPPARRRHMLREIIEWWHREGRSAFGYAQINPHAPRGIR